MMILDQKIVFSILFVVGLQLFPSSAAAPDVLVQLNVNRPLTDVNEKFVSFAVSPEDLYRVLDGTSRKMLTRMASLLGDSYLKFIGDYYFTTNSLLKQRNPAKIIWKGFNRWSRAVNWTMVIPVPYQPRSWDPMETLKILNSSYMEGITDCVWQLGSDFETISAKEYISELNTFTLMLDAFKPYVEDWSVLGADISAGSSPEETRRYIELSKDINAAYGWVQSSKATFSSNNNNYIDGSEPALKVLLNQNIPVWLTFPEFPKNDLVKNPEADTIDAFRWAQTLGEAAISGFDVVFRHLSIQEMEHPSFSFYVSALFKKVMGSRVFNARPLHLFGGGNKKLYTHCANMVSGGIAFMLVNVEESVKQISLRSLTKFSTSELWQYSLTQKKDKVYLNEQRLSLNSSMQPQIKKIISDSQVLLAAPPKSVTFWVLPTAELEHCQFSEVDATEMDIDRITKRQSEYTSADKLIKSLIQETAMPQGLLAKLINRRRRDITSQRAKRFILQDPKERTSLSRVFQPLSLSETRPLRKREEPVEQPESPWNWLTDLLKTSFPQEKTIKRKIRSTDDNYFDSLFSGKNDDQKTGFTKKITEITKPERKVTAIANDGEFDEEEFFKKMGDHQEPEYTRFPDGDVHLRHIATPDGEEIEEGRDIDSKIRKQQSFSEKSKELKSITKPLQLLPTEFFESLSPSPLIPSLSPAKQEASSTSLNSLLFAEPFSKKPYSSKKSGEKVKLKLEKRDESYSTNNDDTNETDVTNFNKAALKFAKEFLIAQKKLRQAYLDEIASENEKPSTSTTTTQSPVEIETTESMSTEAEVTDIFSGDEENLRMLDILTDNLKKYFKEKTNDKSKKPKRSETTGKDVGWLNLASLRKKRAANDLQFYDEPWQNNIISKDDDLKPLGAINPEDMRMYEYKPVLPQDIRVEEASNQTNNQSNNVSKSVDQNTSTQIIATLHSKVTGFVGIITRHIRKWYNAFTISKRDSLTS